MRRFVLGTAGHVDHGKTTLVRALTGVDTDRLPEEKRRGITIELGFAPWRLGDDVEVSVIDVPGHRRLVHTMIAGAIGMQVVLLVVAADEGVMPQTREHVAACELLGIRRVLVAVTKCDRVEVELAQLAGEEARELLGARFEAEVVLCSARTGEGLEAVREGVRRALLGLPAPPRSGSPRLSVDRAFSVRGAGTVVTGTLVEGEVTVGQALYLVGEQGARATGARGLHVHDQAVSAAVAPTRLAINLAGVGLDELHRGDVITGEAHAAPTRLVDVLLRPGGELRHGMAAQLYVGTARSSVRVARLDRSAEESREEESREEENVAREEARPRLARLRLARPLVVFGGDRFVLRGSEVDAPSGAVLGGGTVLDAHPPRVRPRARRRAVLQALSEGSASTTVLQLIQEAAPRPLARAALAARFSLPLEDLVRALDKLVERGEVARLKSTGWIARPALLDLARAARAHVAAHHHGAPLDRGLPLETLRQRLRSSSSPEAAEEAIRLAASKHSALQGEPLVVEGDVVRSPSFTGATAATGGLGIVQQALVAAALKGLTEFQAGEVSGAPPREVKALLARLVRDGEAIHAGELWFSRGAVDGLRARVVAFFEEHAKMSVADFKALSGLGRRQTIMLLELFDREGITRRVGDDRVRAR
ncbi:selenocysteine-specific translation elongation factor [Chondromyces crocatus]|uniref:Selenocysteine-specific elongation factor n=1 Tax=Chondromyces crocatus TaxID=52 RepID=A0A0K1EED9_CHOCO|nr:selenocysteine-specific translation elongation factor [Chondromyces crocatus]AKT39214.1 selenocysteine-specific translation elongation factor [Chondromyces crocatus]